MKEIWAFELASVMASVALLSTRVGTFALFLRLLLIVPLLDPLLKRVRSQAKVSDIVLCALSRAHFALFQTFYARERAKLCKLLTDFQKTIVLVLFLDLGHGF